MHNKDTFYQKTSVTWFYDCLDEDSAIEKHGEPHFISDSDSAYWYYDDYVVRLSGHWGDVGSCVWEQCEEMKKWGGVYDCKWAGVAYWDDFRNIVEECEHKEIRFLFAEKDGVVSFSTPDAPEIAEGIKSQIKQKTAKLYNFPFYKAGIFKAYDMVSSGAVGSDTVHISISDFVQWHQKQYKCSPTFGHAMPERVGLIGQIVNTEFGQFIGSGINQVKARENACNKAWEAKPLFER